VWIREPTRNGDRSEKDGPKRNGDRVWFDDRIGPRPLSCLASGRSHRRYRLVVCLHIRQLTRSQRIARSWRGQSMLEQRTQPRLRSPNLGKIALAQGGTIDCVVHNRSSNGICIEVDSPIRIPESFMLITGTDIRRACRIVWRLGKRIGVAFE
jgi:hypothetical protein